jgi:hypothetical protein
MRIPAAEVGSRIILLTLVKPAVSPVHIGNWSGCATTFTQMRTTAFILFIKTPSN